MIKTLLTLNILHNIWFDYLIIIVETNRLIVYRKRLIIYLSKLFYFLTYFTFLLILSLKKIINNEK